MMSVPIATWTVTGMPSRPAVASEADAGVRRSRRDQVLGDRLAEAEPLADAGVDGAVQDRPGLLGHAEAPGTERGVDVLGRGAADGDLEVVDDAGAVQRQRRDEAALP